MSIAFADNVELKKRIPLDTRIMFEDVPTMVAMKASRLYDGIIAFVRDVDKYYMYNSDNPTTADLGKWKELDFGGANLSFDLKPTTTVGGVSASSDAFSAGTSIENILLDILCPEVKPTMSFSASGAGYKEVGTKVSSTTLTLKITNLSAQTDTITAVEFYKDSELLGRQEFVEGQNTYTYSWSGSEADEANGILSTIITSNTTFKGVVYYKDKKQQATSINATSNFTFTYKTYYGGLATADDISGDSIKALSGSIVGSKGSTQKYTLSNKIMVYAIPKSFGAITKISDVSTGYTLNWSNKEIFIGDIGYYVYYSGVCAVSNYSVKFS